jgi:hypothetical protein
MEKGKVFYTKRIDPEGVQDIFARINPKWSGKPAIKVHFGEEGNQNFLSPVLIKELVTKLNATMVETNVLYASKRRETDTHIELARQHGFDFAPIDILDADGEKVYNVDLKHYGDIKIGKNFEEYDWYLIFSHFKGHGLSGFGGAIKNVSMGLASKLGKMALHASSEPKVKPDRCIQCGLCLEECPQDAISLQPLFIDNNLCIGCGRCIVTCPQNAFGIPWSSTEKPVFLERLVEYAYVTVKKRPMVYINVLANISNSCDCDPHAPEPFMEDIGVLGSTDIVALENASHDLVNKGYHSKDAFLKQNAVSGKQQIVYAHKLGLGKKEYDLIEIDQ